MSTASCCKNIGIWKLHMIWKHGLKPGNRNKGKGNGAGLAWESSVNFTHTLLVQTHNMTTVKEIAEKCCQL